MNRREFLGSGVTAGLALSQPPPHNYSATDGWITVRNGDRFHNRPLYGANRPSAVLAGDRPHLHYLHTPFACGRFMIGFERGGRARWFHEFSDILAAYRAGLMRWTLHDVAFPGLSLKMEALSLADTNGFAVRLELHGTERGDALIWAYGAALKLRSNTLFWMLDPCTIAKRETKYTPFAAQECSDNGVALDGDCFTLVPPLAREKREMVVAGRCSRASRLSIADAAKWPHPAELAESAASNAPLVCGRTSIEVGSSETFWVVESFAGRPVDPVTRLRRPGACWEAGLARVEALASRVTVETPDAEFNAAVPAASAAIDGIYYPPTYVHGAMAWNAPYVGWRSVYGATAFGWHENVLAEAQHYIDAQATEPSFTEAQPDPRRLRCVQSPQSRFYGQGRIRKDHGMYNMQEVFFDELIHAWRWTGSQALEKILRPALDLHLDWMKDCFDPDGDGVYESYINVWASDNVWYNGGGTAQSSAYAFAGHSAAAELASRAGDTARAGVHRAMAAHIREETRKSLWIPERGYLAEYREALAHKRRHDDACLYTIFLPIDAGMMTPLEAVEMLHYTEWGLERIPRPAGGQLCYTSNWVPFIWSVRQPDLADSFHLALAYYQAGLPDQAWELLEGGFRTSMFHSVVPGGLECEPPDLGAGLTDFADTVSMFARTVVEGLYGYRPDYPNGKVTLAPQFPPRWDRASIRTPDFGLAFRHGDATEEYTVQLSRPAQLTLRVPVPAPRIAEVTCDGKPCAWEVTPGYGLPLVVVRAGRCSSAQIVIRRRGALQASEARFFKVAAGQPFSFRPAAGEVIAFEDPQRVLRQPAIRDGTLTGEVAGGAPGSHLVSARVRDGGVEYWQLLKLEVEDAAYRARAASKEVDVVPAGAVWKTLDIRQHFNADVRTIFQQEYLSPRPATTSVQIATNGYSPWCYTFWKIEPPEITLSRIPDLLSSDGKIRDSRGIPFLWPGGANNIAFTSIWDNWPRLITVPVNAEGTAIFLLIAGATSVMQTGIANGVVRLRYKGGTVDEVPLVHPGNFWTLEDEGRGRGTERNRRYDYKREAFALPRKRPWILQLGAHCRAMVIGRKLEPAQTVQSLTLETLSPEVIIGLLGVTIA